VLQFLDATTRVCKWGRAQWSSGLPLQRLSVRLDSASVVSVFHLSPAVERQRYACNRPWRPIGLWDIEAPTFSTQSAHRYYCLRILLFSWEEEHWNRNCWCEISSSHECNFLLGCDIAYSSRNVSRNLLPPSLFHPENGSSIFLWIICMFSCTTHKSIVSMDWESGFDCLLFSIASRRAVTSMHSPIQTVPGAISSL
jgi:hypothetical protein